MHELEVVFALSLLSARYLRRIALCLWVLRVTSEFYLLRIWFVRVGLGLCADS